MNSNEESQRWSYNMKGLKRRVGVLEKKGLEPNVRSLVVICRPGETWDEVERKARASAGIEPDFGSKEGEILAVIRLTVLPPPVEETKS
jgi:hypothetical protein